jgi:hypothetical protein
VTDRPFRFVFFDGQVISVERTTGARRLRADARCFAGDTVPAYAHVCALQDREAAIRFDEPEVQGARRDALAWWIPLLADSFVCLTTLAVDGSRCGGAITVARDPTRFDSDPFARLFPGTTLETDLFSQVDAPAGPVIERYAGAPWPAGRF